FISLHLFRQFLFIPVIFICIIGGALFGTIIGSFYSLIGLTLSSLLFYIILLWTPKTQHMFIKMKQKLIGSHSTLTTPQITFIRLLPFVHFYLLSICLFEMSTDLKDYTKSSFLSTVPFAVVYTSL